MTLLIFRYYFKMATSFVREFYGIVSFFSLLALLSGVLILNRLYDLFGKIEFGYFLFILVYGAVLLITVKGASHLIATDKFFLTNHLKVKRVDRIKRRHLFFTGVFLSMPLIALYYIKFGASFVTAAALSFCFLLSFGYSLLIRTFSVKTTHSECRDFRLSFFRKRNDSWQRFWSVLSLILSYCHREVGRIQIIYFALLLITFNWYVYVVLKNNQLSISWPYLIPAACLVFTYIESNSSVLMELTNYIQKIEWSTYFASVSFSLFSFSSLYFINCLFLWAVFSVNILELLQFFPLFVFLIFYIELLKVGNLNSRILKLVFVCASLILPIAIPIFAYRSIKGISQ